MSILYKMSERIFELEKQGVKVTRLNIGDPGLVTPEALTEACISAIKAGKTKYASAQGEKELLDEIASLQGCSAKNVVATPGSKWACFALLQTTLNKGDNIVCPTPYWATFSDMANQFGAAAKLLKAEFEERWQFDAEKLKELVDKKTKIIILNNPTNPTSVEYDDALVKAIVEYAQDKKVLVFMDEAYRDISFRHQNLTKYAEGLAITNSFSKGYAMSGWRAGYLAASEEIVKRIVKLNQITFTNVPVFIQAAALEGLKRRKEITAIAREECLKRLKAAEKALTGAEYVKPDAGFYMFLKCPDGEKVAEKCLEKGVGVTPGTAFGDHPDFLRVSLSHSPEVLAPALEKVKEAIGETK